MKRTTTSRNGRLLVECYPTIQKVVVIPLIAALTIDMLPGLSGAYSAVTDPEAIRSQDI
jgi:hypothetical protein